MSRRALDAASLAAFLAVMAGLCAFKVFDLDIWWHLKAGAVMVRTHRLIRVDPFAYTRAGQPYLATYEWLAQVILYLVHAAGGSTGLILLRMALASLTFVLVAWIGGGSLWLALPVALFGAETAVHGFMDRPHLFTLALVAAFLVAATRVLDAQANHGASSAPRTVRRVVVAIIVGEIAWVNLHGGAALAGLGVYGALCVQAAWHTWRRGTTGADLRRGQILWWLGAGLVALAAAQFVSPNGVGNLAYLRDLFTDRTQSFITEWQPRPWGPYLRDLGVWWIAALAAIGLVRRQPLFCGLVIVAFGALSRTAYRHEPLFVVAACAVLIYQCRGSAGATRADAWLVRRLPVAAAVLVVAFAAVGLNARRTWIAFGQANQVYGYGSLEMAAGAAAFLDREHVQGPMFNMYDLGGDLLYRGRQVFVDGRNVDYGYDFLARTFAAAGDPRAWDDLDAMYHFTHAVLWYRPFVSTPALPYVTRLARDPQWALGYLDDRVAVYLKRTPENAPIIARRHFALVTPRDLYTSDVLTRTPRAQWRALEEELRALVDADALSIQARLVLAQLYIVAYRHDDARRLVDEAMAIEPRAYQPHEVLGALFAKQARWADAGRELETAMDLAGESASRVDAAALADIFEKAGNRQKAQDYRQRAARSGG
jgi:hypothetical protein